MDLQHSMTFVMIPAEELENLKIGQQQILNFMQQMSGNRPKAKAESEYISASEFMAAVGIKRTKFYDLLGNNKIKTLKKCRKTYVLATVKGMSQFYHILNYCVIKLTTMKGLTYLTNVQRAKLLYDLFPIEIADFIVFDLEVAEKILREKEQLKSTWNEGNIFPAAYWIGLAETSVKKLKQADGKLAKSGVTFSEQLFNGDNAFFSKHCLLQFVNNQKVKNQKFKQAVELLFIEGS